MADTAETLADAIRAYVKAEGDGAYLTDWVLIAAGAMPAEPDSTVYITESSDGPVHHRLGLVRYLSRRTDGLVPSDDDDD